jgi:Hint domain
MPVYSVWMLQKTNITVSGGGSLDGLTQGDGSHLVGRTITMNSPVWKETQISDNDGNFDDNDTNQRLSGAQTINGVTYPNNTQVEAEYTIVLRNPLTGLTYTAYGYNVSTGSPAFGTIEGLSFRGGLNGFPPFGVPLQVVSAAEGPGSLGQAANPYSNVSYPPCFTTGARIMTPEGPKRIETLQIGDMVCTRDHASQAIRWIGKIPLTAPEVMARDTLRPVILKAGSLGDGCPRRTIRVSQQHRFVMRGWKAELLFGVDEVLVAARDLIDDKGIWLDRSDAAVCYYHLMFDRHELIWVDGAETESLFPAGLGRMQLPDALLAEIQALFPDAIAGTGTFGPPARPCLKSWESRLLSA